MVVNVQPDGRIYNLGRIQHTVHVYDTNIPAGGNTGYQITIVDVTHQNRTIQPGHTHSYSPGGNAVYIQNNGPSRLQVLYADGVMTPEDAGWKEVEELPKKTG